MKPARIAILILILVGLASVAAWQSQKFFLRNNVTFLLNQRRFDEALQLIEKLDRRYPDDQHVDSHKIKALAITGDYTGAVDAATSLKGDVAHPEALYWLAIAQYQLGMSGRARQTAARFVETGDRLPAASPTIALALSGKSRILQPPDKEALEYRLLFPVEQAVYLGLSGLHQLEIGRLDTAAEMIRDSFLLENRNPQYLYQGAKVLALVGDVQGAQMLLDHSATASIISLFNDLHQLYGNFQAASLTLNSDDVARGGRKIDVARAVAWAATKSIEVHPEIDATTVSQMMSDMLTEFPYDPTLQVRQASLLETINDRDGALSLYREVLSKNPNFMVLVRMLALEGTSETEFSRRTGDFMGSLDPIAALSPRELRVEGGDKHDHYILFHDSGYTTATITIAERGSYNLTLVAKGEPSEEKYPLLKVSVDDAVAGLNYICRNQWDCYVMAIPLEAGEHTVTLEFLNGAGSAEPDINRNRSLYLRSLYVTLAGVADVR